MNKVMLIGDVGRDPEVKNTTTGTKKVSFSLFKSADRKFLRLALNIVSTNIPQFKISLKDISIKFTRNRTDNFLVKTQGLQGLLTSGVHPRIALATSGLFSDPEQVYVDSMEYLEKWKESEKETKPEDNFPIEGVMNQL